jgi:SIR2-like domain
MPDDLILPLDALVRSIEINRSVAHAVFLGAGASVSSGVPSAQMCIWEWKRDIFITNNPGLEDQFSELSLPGPRQKIQQWLNIQGVYPAEGGNEEYGFYFESCFPIRHDRRAYYEDKVRQAQPNIGYRLLAYLAEADLIRAVWSTNFDGLPARATANFKVTPVEVGIDTQARLPRLISKGELLCVSLHGDYRYDDLKATDEEVQNQETSLREAFIRHVQETPLIVSGYSGRDKSVMEAFRAAYSQGSAPLYWCGYADQNIPTHIADLIQHARDRGRVAYYIPTEGFDDLLIRLGLHCSEGDRREFVQKAISEVTPAQSRERAAFSIPQAKATALIKSNAFEIECPSEVFQFELKKWPEEGAWSWVRDRAAKNGTAAIPFRGKVLALGIIDNLKESFGENINGPIERIPVTPDDLRYDDGAVVSLMKEALTRSMADAADVPTDGQEQLWLRLGKQTSDYIAHDSVHVFLRCIGSFQYLILKPSIKIFSRSGDEIPAEQANPIKLRLLGYQHNKEFNHAIDEWRKILFTAEATVFEFPKHCGSTFKFRVHKYPIFAEISSSAGKPLSIPNNHRSLIKHRGFQLDEPTLIFSNTSGTTTSKDSHPIRGLIQNRPFDYPLTQRGLVRSIKLGVVCPISEAQILHTYLQNVHQNHQPPQTERDYLIDFPGFETAYGLPLVIPKPQQVGWASCPEPPSIDNPHRGPIELAKNITQSIEALEASYAPNVVLIFFPERWNHLRGFRTEDERFDLHDFVKAFCVQRGFSTQFLNQDTLRNASQCRIWWWLSLALYVKSMRTPWVLDYLDDDTAFVGLGFTIDPTAEKGSHVVLGCSHIYSNRGEGLQYRLSKVENPIFKGRNPNPFMSEQDARRTGETIRTLFYESRMKLPHRVVIHKCTPFLKQERDGLFEGLGGIDSIDMLEIHLDHALRYVTDGSYPVRRGSTLLLDDYTALLWVHGATAALNPRLNYFQGKRRIPAPVVVKRHAGQTALNIVSREILGLSKMNWNTFDLYSRLPATVHSSNEIARIGSLLQRFGSSSYDYRLFI